MKLITRTDTEIKFHGIAAILVAPFMFMFGVTLIVIMAFGILFGGIASALIWLIEGAYRLGKGSSRAGGS